MTFISTFAKISSCSGLKLKSTIYKVKVLIPHVIINFSGKSTGRFDIIGKFYPDRQVAYFKNNEADYLSSRRNYKKT